MVLLNGRLQIEIIEARGLPDLDYNPLNPKDKSDPYCVVDAVGANGTKRLGKTETIDDCLNPKWKHTLISDVSYDISGLKFTVKDRDLVSSETLGSCFVDVLSFASTGKKFKGFQNLSNSNFKSAGSVRIEIRFTGAEGVEAVPDSILEKVIKRERSRKSIDVGPMKYIFLHGALDIHIDKAVNLPNMDSSFLSIGKKDVSDPFLTVLIQDGVNQTWKVAITSVVDNDLNPVWNERFHVNVCHEVANVLLVIRDKDVLGSEEIGRVIITADQIETAKTVTGPLNIFSKLRSKKSSQLHFRMTYKTAEEVSASYEVPNCLFPSRQNNRVTLYQDTHACKLKSKVFTDQDSEYMQASAWKDMHTVLTGAKEYIYIIGWSVNVKISLLRWHGEDHRSLGDILAQKADEGVHVVVMLWDEVTSTDLNVAGFMSTSDQATADFFRTTRVECVLAPRERKNTHLISTKSHFTNLCYTHHQKCIIVDVENQTGTQRSPVAFVGGLDLARGRFDTPDHSLFDTMHTDHKEDFHNSLILTTNKVGPRQPWHDIHCKLEGDVAFDILTNFQERWNKQGNSSHAKQLIEPKKASVNLLRRNDSWNVQMFRSINGDSAMFFDRRGSPGLSVKKGRLFENSIHRAYIHQIRRSTRFLYIENQYFMGSSHAWFDDRDADVCNLVPLEIVTHIEQKIKTGQRYSAYVVIPMFPEGRPADKTVQEILYWQFRTIEMMYKRIASAIAEAGIDAKPQDYLLFLCLGKRESGSNKSAPFGLDSFGAKAFKNKRLMIYVHSKMAIFDDDYIIVGSANINDRSLSGNRDTEIAIGAYQPNCPCRTNQASGEISAFRKSLWVEHMGEAAPMHMDPSSLQCIRHVRQTAQNGLDTYIGADENGGSCNLLIYPLQVNDDGSVTANSKCPTIPDTQCSFLGARSALIPKRLTT